jgi:hypothetical protein
MDSTSGMDMTTVGNDVSLPGIKSSIPPPTILLPSLLLLLMGTGRRGKSGILLQIIGKNDKC